MFRPPKSANANPSPPDSFFLTGNGGECKVSVMKAIKTAAEIDRLCSLPNAKLEIGKKPAKKFNRNTFNRMSGDEQKEYDRACNVMVDDFRIDTGSTFYSITKSEFEYAKTILG